MDGHKRIECDVICGGFPCQDISIAGNCEGIHAARSGLWWEMYKTICILRPRFVIVENVANLVNLGLEEILGALAEIGYDAEWTTLFASSFGNPQPRERLFIIAYLNEIGRNDRAGNRSEGPILPNQRQYGEKNQPKRDRRNGGSNALTNIQIANPDKKRVERLCKEPFQRQPEYAPFEDVRRVEDLFDRPGIPPPLIYRIGDGGSHWLDRIEALGDAVVPSQAEYIGRAILAYDGANEVKVLALKDKAWTVNDDDRYTDRNKNKNSA